MTKGTKVRAWAAIEVLRHKGRVVAAQDDPQEINWCPRCGTETRPCGGNESGIQAVAGQAGCPVCNPRENE